VTAGTITAVIVLSIFGMACHIANVALHADASGEVGVRLLRRGSQWKCQDQ
jgi:hypothetical protein